MAVDSVESILEVPKTVPLCGQAQQKLLEIDGSCLKVGLLFSGVLFIFQLGIQSGSKGESQVLRESSGFETAATSI